MKKNRIYAVKDIEMLLASRTIANNFIANLSELAGLRTNWDESYAESLANRIDSVIDEFMGVDKRKELREATEKVTLLQISVLRDLNFLKKQILIDFPDEQKKLLNKLGFTRYGEGARNRDQEALIALLLVFKKEMNDRLKSTICAKGTNPVLIDRIIEYADQLKHLNTIQESLKTTSKQVTGNLRDTFNALYTEVLGVCKIAQTFYQLEPLKQEQFVFSNVVSNMNQS